MESDQLTGTGKLASAGKPEPMTGIPGQQQAAPAAQQAAPAAEAGATEEKAAAGTTETGEQQAAAPAETTDQPAGKELTKEEIKALYEKNFPVEETPSEAQKTAAEKELDKRLHDLYVAQGGKGEDYYKIKEVLSMDLTTITKAQLTEEMKAGGFSDEEISAMQVQRYYQMNPEELEQDVEETDAEFEKRKELVKKQFAFGSAKLQKKGERVKTDAQEILDTLKEALKDQDLQKQQAAEFTAKVDEVVKAMPSKLSVELGKLDNQDLGSVQTDVSDTDRQEIAAILKTPEQLNKILYTDSGVVNVERISQLLLVEKLYMKAAREALLEGQTRQVAIFRNTFGERNPAALGVRNGSSSGSGGTPGKLVSAGKPQVMNPAQRVTK